MQSVFIQRCPACTAVLSFAADNTNVIICTACKSTINRSKDGTLLNKPQFTILYNVGIIQPGTTGVIEGKNFTVLGRFRAWFEESVFSYWTIMFDNKETMWLAEGYGIYAVLKDAPSAKKLSPKDFQDAAIGELKQLGEKAKFILEKKYKTIKWEVEGELYIPDNMVSNFKVMEFSNVNGKNLAYFEFPKENILAFEVTYVSFEQLQFKNLREYVSKGKSFTCSGCSTTIEVKTYPYAQSCACQSCGTKYSLKDGMDFKKGKSTQTNEIIYIPIGSSGVIDGISYEVIGYAQKEEQNIYHSKWREYTLYNPAEGFAFLSEYDGHWIYVRETCDSPVLVNQNERDFTFNSKLFDLFNSYNYIVVNAKGEFPYNIFDNQNAKVREFIAPPEVWIQERDRQEGITWFLGRHISSKEITGSFSVFDLPRKKGVGAVQPNGYISRTKMAVAAIAAVFILMVIHFFIGNTKQNRVLLSDSFLFNDSTDKVSLVTEKYVLDKWSSNIRIAINAPVVNSWFELAATLVNAETGKEYSVEKGVEYYYGFSEGESWSEGSTTEDAYFTRIPAGTYFLQLQGTRENLSGNFDHFYLDITYDVTNDRNLWWSIFLLLLWPVSKYVYLYYTEKARWSNSPYSNYES